MLADQSTYMPAEVEADIKKVMDAYSKAANDVSDDALTGVTGMKGAIDSWAASGRKAAATRADVPCPTGWQGWTNAGTNFMQGLEDIDAELSHVVLDAITAQALNAPKTTVEATVKTVSTIAKKTTAAAKSAVKAAEDVGASVGKGVTSAATRVALAAVAVAVLLVVVKKNA